MKNLKKIKKIFIAGKPYAITWTDEFVMGKNTGTGYGAYQKIYISGDRPYESVLETLWHEIMHMVSEEGGLNLDEHQVQAIGSALCNIILSNFKIEPKPEIT